jgi:hypothetical protein
MGIDNERGAPCHLRQVPTNHRNFNTSAAPDGTSKRKDPMPSVEAISGERIARDFGEEIGKQG